MNNPERGQGQGQQGTTSGGRGMLPPPTPRGKVHNTTGTPFESGHALNTLLDPVTGPGLYRNKYYHDTPRGRELLTSAGPLNDNSHAPHMQQDHEARMRESRMGLNILSVKHNRRKDAINQARGGVSISNWSTIGGGSAGSWSAIDGGSARGGQQMARDRGGFSTLESSLQRGGGMGGGMMGGRGQPGENSFGPRGYGLGLDRGGFSGRGRGR